MAYRVVRRKSLFEGLFSLVSYTNWLILANVILFFVFTIILAFNQGFLGLIELQPSAILQGDNLWTIITSMFMHQGGFHLLVNMFTLFFLGSLTEKIIGKKRFLMIYIISGIVGALFFVIGAWIGSGFELGDRLFGGLDDFAAGASGALFGLLGVLTVLLPRYRVYLVAGPIVIIILEFLLLGFIPENFRTGFLLIMNLLAFISIFALFSRNKRFRKLSFPIGMPLWIAPIAAIVPLVIVGLFVKLPIGNSAHLGGLVAGLVYGWILIRRYPNKIGKLRRLFSRFK